MVAFYAWATSQHLRNVELTNCPFRMVHLSSTGDGRSLRPIIWLLGETLFCQKCIVKKNYTENCISVAESHCRCDGGHFQGGGKRLDDAGMETGSSGGNGEGIVQSLAGGRPQIGRRHAFRTARVLDSFRGKRCRSGRNSFGCGRLSRVSRSSEGK